MTTFIIGSRKNPIYPKVEPNDIIFINGSFLSTKLPDFKNANRNFVENFDEIFSGFLRTFRSLPEVHEGGTKEVLRRYSRIGTSSGGRCMRPDAPLFS